MAKKKTTQPQQTEKKEITVMVLETCGGIFDGRPVDFAAGAVHTLPAPLAKDLLRANRAKIVEAKSQNQIADHQHKIIR